MPDTAANVKNLVVGLQLPDARNLCTTITDLV